MRATAAPSCSDITGKHGLLGLIALVTTDGSNVLFYSDPNNRFFSTDSCYDIFVLKQVPVKLL